MTLKVKTKEQLHELAWDFVKGLVFSSTMLPVEGGADILTKIFMPLIALTPEAYREMQDYAPVVFYEYYDKALGPKIRSHTDYPQFVSMNMLNQEEYDEFYRARKIYENALQKAKELLGEADQ